MVNKKIGGEIYNCFSPEECTAPMGTMVAEILVDKEEYVLARINYRGNKKPSLAIRWYASDKDIPNGEKCLGYPNTRGKPTWFVLPDDLLMDIQGYL